MRYRDYIWDLGGTLLDNYEVSTQAFIETLDQYGKVANHDQVYSKLKESTAIAIETFASDIPHFLKAYKDREAQHLELPQLVLGAKEILAKIVREDSRNFLVSHRDRQVLSLLKATDIESYFVEVVTSESGFKRKPSPESFIYLKDKYHIDNALVIGDREIDSLAGKSAGFDTLLVDGKTSLLEIVK
ncbi:HAD hydrolase, family IA [Streptococcus urinalis FB127-CNA-2]|uniref:HAD hydrolase, family IA, variant 1 n=1 Tax=Streptococcus urinalis 2285-97 TaxID=764291 RepID=G5KEZ1_9STRE|nr:hydrolase [Streptococcus urinalis]EHJ57107.1 HAD hydrolase, family IA, variant 1 [Streptococcus urinalis 2285-97]EKS21958.1 HAD hydrolase, family IA [Streptococcus urinalis FB127-CNA-2]VEF31771.1 haloacid dehalogenase [Streptococcus urinalis]